MTGLTQKQLIAFQLACQLGYYKYPRSVSLEQLAKAAKLSYSTYKEHLRRAEEKIMPHVISYD
ncbi:MAG: helix-turn-helix domain-containing protein [Candidatus Micrarchaeota archaeon]|nr:helix-turn-helix domain-containing protein [Candidatus Micrarchaeota archaeon]